jgi:hypothetical protein
MPSTTLNRYTCDFSQGIQGYQEQGDTHAFEINKIREGGKINYIRRQGKENTIYAFQEH